MVDVNVDFIFENEEPINADFQLEPDVTYIADIKLSEATRDHTKLYNRDEANQHPMSAITGLESALGDLDTAIGNEVTARENADGILSGAIDSNHNAITEHVSDKSNPHEVTKAQVGLGNVDNTSDSDKPVSTATQTALDGKVDKTNVADKVYGTDSSGNQTTYNVDSFGKVDDVKVAGVSVVTNKIANLGTMASETASDYYTSAQVDTALSAKQDNLTAGTGIDITSNEVSVTDPTLVNNGTGTKALAVGKTSQSTAEGGVAVGYGAQANSTYGTAVGYESRASNTNTTVIGKGAKATQARAIAIGSGAEATAQDAIAIKGVNNTANTFQVYTYNMLDMATGLIPDARISTNIARASDIPTNYVTTDTAQTITGTKTFHNCAIESDNFITLTSPNAYVRYSGSGVVRGLLRRNSSGTVEVGSSNDPVKIQGSATRPAYNSSDLALYSDVTSGDSALQSQIDALVVASDVFDIVGTYAELQAYDISTVPVNDIIKVLVDSTHDGAATYYRCVETGGVKSWSYIGSEGAYYTKGEADSKFVPQTRTVNSKALSSDITLTASDVGALPDSTVIPTVNDATVTIQKNGSTVSTFTLNQSSNEAVNITVPTDTGDLTNGAGFITGITSGDVTTALGYTPVNPSSLANVATSGDYDDLINKPTIPTVGDGTITITQGGVTKGAFTTNQSGNSTIALDAGGAGGIQNTATGTDSLTILGNSTQYEQAINIGQESYAYGNYATALGGNDPEYGECQADDYGVSIGASAQGGVGSTAVGYAAVDSGSGNTLVGRETFIDEYVTNSVAIGREAQVTGEGTNVTNAVQIGAGVNQTSNTVQMGNYPALNLSTGLIPDARISSNIARTADTITTADLATCHVVVETYHNGVNWYRVYDDKWCEQGQMFQTIANGTNITFLKPFASNSYSLSTTNVGAGVSGYGGFQITNLTANGFTVTDANYGKNDKTACWEAKGYIA